MYSIALKIMMCIHKNQNFNGLLWLLFCRAPKPRQRPCFRDVLLAILENENVVLHVPSDVTGSHPQAATLGAPLKAGLNMYGDVQRKYAS